MLYLQNHLKIYVCQSKNEIYFLTGWIFFSNFFAPILQK